MAIKPQEHLRTSVDKMESGLSGEESQKKLKNFNIVNGEVQRLSNLPRRAPVNLEFNNLSYTVPDGPWWRKKGTVSSAPIM